MQRKEREKAGKDGGLSHGSSLGRAYQRLKNSSQPELLVSKAGTKRQSASKDVDGDPCRLWQLSGVGYINVLSRGGISNRGSGPRGSQWGAK